LIRSSFRATVGEAFLRAPDSNGLKERSKQKEGDCYGEVATHSAAYSGSGEDSGVLQASF
jgi:hypothetical protein